MVLQDLTKHKIVFASLLILFVAWFAYSFNHGEKVQHNAGLGWDGSGYAVITWTGVEKLIKGKHLNEYRIQRILPAAIIDFTSKIAGYKLKPEAKIVQAFRLLNITVIFIGLIFLWLIIQHFRWGLPIRLIAFSSVFLNYPVLKMSMYYPILCDIPAFTLGIMMAYFYLKRMNARLFLTTLISAFVFPSMLVVGLILFVFSTENNKTDLNFKPNALSKYLVAVCSVSMTVFSLILTYTMAFISSRKDLVQVNHDLLYLSAFCMLVYLIYAFLPLSDIRLYLLQFKSYLKDKKFYCRALFGLLLFLLVRIFIIYFSNKSPGAYHGSDFYYLETILQLSLVNPFVNFVSHIMYYGPIVCVILFLWRSFVAVVKEHGFGLVLFVCFYLIMLLGSESRQYINALPLFAIIGCEVLNRLKVGWLFAYSFLVLSLVISRFWLKLNVVHWVPGMKDLLLFPKEMYFMSQGPWMIHYMYGVFLAISILLMGVVYFMIRLVKAENLQSKVDV